MEQESTVGTLVEGQVWTSERFFSEEWRQWFSSGNQWKGKHLLDLGCGVYPKQDSTPEAHEQDKGPRFCDATARVGWQVTGVDHRPLGRELPADWSFVQANCTTSQFWKRLEPGSLDVVSACLWISLRDPSDISPSLKIKGAFEPYWRLTDFSGGANNQSYAWLNQSDLYKQFLDKTFERVHKVLKERGVFFIGNFLDRHLFVKERGVLRSLLGAHNNPVRPNIVVGEL